MKIGSKVDRIEDRAITGATILEIDGENALIKYDEGGQGWWPLQYLRLAQSTTTRPIANEVLT